MSDRSAIEWTDATWTPGHPFEQEFDLRLVAEKLEQPLRWRRPRKIFVNSMSDLCHEDVQPSTSVALERIGGGSPDISCARFDARAGSLRL